MAKIAKKKGFKRFFIGLLIFAVVFSGLALWGLTEFWNFIDAYEVSRPKNTIAPYVQQLTKEQIAGSNGELLNQIDHNIQSEDACKQFILDSLTQDITYAQNISESSDTQLVYMLLHDGKPIGKVTLKPQEADKYGFTPWTVASSSYDFSHLIGEKATVTVPNGFTVYANGVALDSSYITQDNIQYDALKSYYKDYQPPYKVTYTVAPILGEIQLSFTDRSGNPIALDDSTDLDVFMNNCTEAQETAISDLLTPFLRSYVAFTSNQGGKDNSRNNYRDLTKYLVSGGDMANRMYNALDGLSWAKDSGSQIIETHLNHIVNLGSGRYLCDVTYIVEAEVYRDDPITVNDVKIILVETSSGLRVESLVVY